MSTPLPRLAISQITTHQWTLEEDLQQLADLGLPMELWEGKFNENDLERQLELVRAAKLKISSVQPKILTVFPSSSYPDPQNVDNRVDMFKTSIRRFAPLAQGMPFVTNTGALPDGNEQQVWDTCVEKYRELAVFAEAHGVRIALEALSPSLMNRNSILYNLGQVREMVKEVSHPAFGICIDFYNNWQQPDIEQEIQRCAGHIFLVQVSDWRRPRSFHDRLNIGAGSIPAARLLAACQRAGYTGDYVLEIFSENVPGALWEQDNILMIRESNAGFRQVIQEWKSGKYNP